MGCQQQVSRERFFLFENKAITVGKNSHYTFFCASYPLGTYVRTLGPIGNVDTETEALLLEHELSILPFSPQCLAELPRHTSAEPWKIPEQVCASFGII